MELVDLVNFVIFSNDLTEIVNVPTRIPGCDSHSPALLNFFLSSDASIGSTNGIRLELMYISLIVSIRSNLTHLHDFQQLVLLP